MRLHLLVAMAVITSGSVAVAWDVAPQAGVADAPVLEPRETPVVSGRRGRPMDPPLGVTPSPSPSPDGDAVVPDPPVEHGEAVTTENTGLRGAGYTYDATADTYRHPTRGPLTPSDSITTTHDGQVIDHVDVRGRIRVRHAGVVIRNCRVTYGGTLYAIDAARSVPEAAGTSIEHCEIRHDGPEPHRAFGIYLTEGTVRWSHISGFQVGVYGTHSNYRVEYTKVSDPRKIEGTHGSGMSADNGGRDIVFFRNNIEGNTSATLSLFARKPFHGLTVEDNLFEGGTTPSYCLNAGDNKGGVGRNTGIRIVGNLFGRSPYPRCGQYGPYMKWDGSRPGAVWCDNRWRDTREVVGTETGCQ